jgi:MoaA/NifB/PqqE/SkfB family radical SAM enzyme
LLADKYTMLKFFPHETIPGHVAVFTGDTCNLACVLCEPYFSTRWQYELGQQHSKQISIEPDIEEFDFDSYNSVLFTGGEPILNSSTLQILKKLKSKTHVAIHMNGTVLPSDEFVETCKKFENISFLFSIDDINEQFEFLRYPARWDQVTHNILHLKDCLPKNISIGVLTVVSILNETTHMRVEEWVKTHISPQSAWNTQNSNGILDRFTYQERKQEYVNYLDGLDVKRKSNWRQLFPEAATLLQY